MDAILLSFLQGAAFLGGAATVFVGLGLVYQMRDTKGREEVAKQWEKQVGLLSNQVIELGRMAESLESINDSMNGQE